MASIPPFQLEEQTDEDFFDKLVDDDFSPSQVQASASATGRNLVDGNDSDDATAFANLSISDDSGGHGTLHDAEPGNDVAKASIGGSLGAPDDGEGDPSAIASEAAEFVCSDANESGNEGVISKVEEAAVSATAGASLILDGSGGSGIKEVGWSSFYADSSVNNGYGFGSYSDLLSEFEENSRDSQRKMNEFISGGGNMISNDTNNKSISLENLVGLRRHQGELDSTYANGQDSGDSQYWENLYPGWKYDSTAGQWYQVDGHEESTNLLGGYYHTTDDGGEVSAEKSDVAYLRQSTQSAVETVTETGTTESVSGWNQFSLVNNGYPEHMVLDPQYPGWYYDMIAREWRTLDSYNAAAQTSGQAHSQQVQNGRVSTSGYTGDNKISDITDMYGEYRQKQTLETQAFGSQEQQGSWDRSTYAYNNSWQSGSASRAGTAVTYSLSSFDRNQQMSSYHCTEAVVKQSAITQTIEMTSQGQFKANEIGVQSFSPPHNGAGQNGSMTFSNDFYGSQISPDVTQQSFQSSQQFFHAPTAGRSPDGRPSHVLVSFGFGGKLIVTKDNNGSLQNSCQVKGTWGSSISVLNLADFFSGNINASSMGGDTSGYFRCLYQQSFPGPLVGGHVGSKDLNKWLDERIVNVESLDVDFSRGKLLRLLLSLLKISCQYYGKLRSPFGTDTAQKEMDTPEAAVAKLFTFGKKDGIQNVSYAALSQCLQLLPPEAQLRVTASEVQSLLVSGRKMDALQCAQEGHLWGPALVIAAQLGDQFYVDTVKQMALRQLVPGSPLRSLCLLIAGQPAEVFSTGSAGDSSLPGSMRMSQHQPQFGSNSMLDNWEENLAIITANRTKDDELVITHLGDCLWKERSEIIAAHICYLVADTNMEPYSDGARLCLLGADHWKYPRTYATPEAIQRTELYEYAKVLGNSQYILLPFQPYKLLYAHMLAEVGKVSESLKYCQAVLKCLKTGRAPEVETWKQLVLLLEERIRIHQQGGYTANIGPAKLVGKLLNFFDSTAHRVVGSMPPPAPSSSAGNFQVDEFNHQAVSRVFTNQSTMAMSSLMPSSSMEPIREWVGDGSTMTVQARSVSEPNFGRTRKQDQVDSLKDRAVNEGSQDKSSETGTGSRFSRFGIGILKKTVGRVLQARPSREAKLGEENKFYYDEKLKRWVERGVEPPAEEAALPPPPTMAAFQNNSSSSENKSDSNNEMSPAPSGNQSFGSLAQPDNSSGIPPICSGSNQFSARGRMGVRARYVDTFNQGRGNTAATLQSSPLPSVKPSIPTNTKFFIPTTHVTQANNQGAETTAETVQEENTVDEASSDLIVTSQPFQASPLSPVAMQRFPSMVNIKRTRSGTNVKGVLSPSQSRRTASWSGGFNSSFTPPDTKKEPKSSCEPQVMSATMFARSPLSSCSSFGDELQEVEL